MDTVKKPEPPLTESEINRRTHLIFLEEAAAKIRRETLVRELTGLGRYDFSSWERRATIITAQAAKIDGLKTQMSQMKLGYERKIARLRKRIAQLETGQ